MTNTDRLAQALRELIADITDRFDMDSPSTNPGMKLAVKNGLLALAHLPLASLAPAAVDQRIDTWHAVWERISKHSPAFAWPHSTGQEAVLTWIDEHAAQVAALTAQCEGLRKDGKAHIVGDAIVIAIALDALASAVTFNPALEHYDDDSGHFHPPIVTDKSAWANAVVTELNAEEENGTTLIHKMFDAAFVEAIEQGAEGIVIHDDDSYAAIAAGNGEGV